MKYAVVVTQHVDDVLLTACSPNIGERLQRSVITNILPTGSDWGNYIGARSFRFVPVNYRNYLLSFSLVLGEAQGEWDGQLHAWGLLGTLESFLTESSLRGNNPRVLFLKNSRLFEVDYLYDVMIGGLQPTSPSPPSLHLPWLLRLLLSSKKTGFSWKFTDAAQWSNIENWLYLTFQYSLPGNRWWQREKQPKSFSTFTLSTSEPTEMIGLPSKNNQSPVFGTVI